MRLGISYNLFDGEELLEGSIQQIRKLVDYVSVVYQTTSNFGNPCNPGLVPLLEKLKLEGLIDELFDYSPKVNKGGHSNEIQKRNIGLALSQGAGCTHHMSMDSDEYYIASEFEYLKNRIIDGIYKKIDYDATYCQMQTYYKSSDYALTPPEDYYVSLIFKIKPDSSYILGAPSPVLVDPTRRMSPTNTPLILKREEIQMHHMSFVRKDISMKLTNSSAKTSFIEKIPAIINHYNNWTYPNKVMWASGQLLDVQKVTNDFNAKF